MNYRHSYHAGNFADVFKHIVLTFLIEALKNKDKPFCYLDTHAGIGVYDLLSGAAQKTHEADNGILALLQQKKFPEELAPYLSIIQAANREKDFSHIRFYPGSPFIVRQLIRPSDRMILCELHEEEFAALKQEFAGDKQVAVHHLDGYQGLKAFLPPKEKRGLVFMDPPFEQPNEFEQIISALKTAYARWQNGIYTIWFPLKKLSQVKSFYKKLENSSLQKILLIEFSIYPIDSPFGLNGCGMVIINPPWKFAEQIQTVLPWLLQVLSPQNQGNQLVKHLKIS